MTKLIITAAALALLVPMTAAKADPNSDCANGLSLNFCGSVEVTTIPTSDDGANVLFRAINADKGIVLGGFTAIGLAVIAARTDGPRTVAGTNADKDCEEDCRTTATPEPATLALFATGLLALGRPVSRWRRRRNGSPAE